MDPRAAPGPARVRHGRRLGDRPGRVGRLFPDVVELPDADHAGDRHRRRQGPPRRSSRTPRSSTPEGLVVTQHEADVEGRHSRPVFPGRPREDLALDGTNPTLLYGYGGFEISMVPGYSRSGRASAGWRRGASTSSPTSAAAASSARVAPGRAQGQPATRPTRTSPPSPRT